VTGRKEGRKKERKKTYIPIGIAGCYLKSDSGFRYRYMWSAQGARFGLRRNHFYSEALLISVKDIIASSWLDGACDRAGRRSSRRPTPAGLSFDKMVSCGVKERAACGSFPRRCSASVRLIKRFAAEKIKRLPFPSLERFWTGKLAEKIGHGIIEMLHRVY